MTRKSVPAPSNDKHGEQERRARINARRQIAERQHCKRNQSGTTSVAGQSRAPKGPCHPPTIGQTKAALSHPPASTLQRENVIDPIASSAAAAASHSKVANLKTNPGVQCQCF